MNQDWDAQGYAQGFGFVPQYGQDVMGLLDYDHIRTLLDLGCGNGALTAQLAEQGMQVVGMDASAAMLERARQMHPKLTFMQADATAFSLPEPVDAVFSNAGGCYKRGGCRAAAPDVPAGCLGCRLCAAAC